MSAKRRRSRSVRGSTPRKRKRKCLDLTDSDLSSCGQETELHDETQLPNMFECNICLEQVLEFEKFIAGCGHYQCRDCAGKYYTHSIRNHRYPLSCAMCRKPLSLSDLEVVVPPDVLEIYLTESQFWVIDLSLLLLW
eukprot:TRINITY_DN6423_c0_g2_i1.p2 TRINITY_DN6423_c0_g2~~TRINITY_DN6423_c0_g2_i1.p2  ORF type:complete len:137 (+),score=21.50 TRINITY_DN6423_c0_g2_i1:347-757(+)